MGYYVDFDGKLTFQSLVDREKFLADIKPYTSIEKYLEDTLNCLYVVQENGLSFRFSSDDVKYIRPDCTLLPIIKNSSCSATFFISYYGEDGECWEVFYNKQACFSREHTSNITERDS